MVAEVDIPGLFHRSCRDSFGPQSSEGTDIAKNESPCVSLSAEVCDGDSPVFWRVANEENGNTVSTGDDDGLHLSFSGAGFLGFFHLAVLKAFEQYCPEVLTKKMVGTSAGALTAACYCCGLCPERMLTESINLSMTVGSRILGIFDPSFNLDDYVRASLNNTLPPNAHELCNGRVYISVTRWRDGANETISQFHSRDDLIEALVCSSHIPIFSGLLPARFRGKYYWDGGMSNNCPRLSENTITVCPFSSPSCDICPNQELVLNDAYSILSGGIEYSMSLENLQMMVRALFPFDPVNILDLFASGYNSATLFLQKKGYIKSPIPRLSSVPGGVEILEKGITQRQYNPEIKRCFKVIESAAKKSGQSLNEEDRSEGTSLTKMFTKSVLWSLKLPFGVAKAVTSSATGWFLPSTPLKDYTDFHASLNCSRCPSWDDSALPSKNRRSCDIMHRSRSDGNYSFPKHFLAHEMVKSQTQLF